MAFKKENHHRRSIRLPDYDYSTDGWYFITICVQNRECLFGSIENGTMRLNELGKIVRGELLKTPQIRPEILLDEFAVMPNHIHAIFVINAVGAHGRAPLQSLPFLFRKPKSLGSLIAGFKSATTKNINQLRRLPHCPVWQRNYYDHIIRDEKSYWAIREYIRNNPVNWAADEENLLKRANI